jgi:hypothetical protein
MVLNTRNKLSLWLRWVGANALAELVGLGATFAIDFLIIARSTGQGMLGSLVSIVQVTASGAIEGSVVGLLQWSVLRRPFPGITRRAWVLATIVGAMVAWFFGSLPSTLIDMGAQQSGTDVQEPSSALVLLLAAGMGLVLGVVLAYPQWRVLRRVVAKAWWWIPANSAAWALGMMVIFAAMDLAFKQPTPVGSAMVIAGALLLAGAVVGAVHGLVLVRLAANAQA